MSIFMRVAERFKNGKFAQTMKNILQSEWFALFVLCYGVFSWAINNMYALIIGYVVIIAFICFFADDVKNLFAVIFFAPLYIKDVMQYLPLTLYGVAIVLAFVAFAAFIIRKRMWKNVKSMRGSLTVALIVSTVAFLIGGGISYFNTENFFVTFALCLANFLLYHFAINHTERLKEYLFFLFFSGAIAIFMQTVLAGIFEINVRDGNGVVWIGCEGVNTVAIYTALGMVGAFGIGREKPFDVAAFVLATLLAILTVRTNCRTVIAIAAVAYVIGAVDLIKASKKNRWWFLIVIPIIGLLLGGMFLFANERTLEFFNELFTKFTRDDNYTSGRFDSLWPYCWEKFTSNPWLGVGYTTTGEDLVPALRPTAQHFILAHNTVIQWLASLGIIGTLLMGYFCFAKYKTLFTTKPKENLYVIICVLIIALSGMMDQAASMEYFIWLMPIIFTAAVERTAKEPSAIAKLTKTEQSVKEK